MRNLNTIAPSVLLALMIFIGLEVKVSAQETRSTTINWQVLLDNAQNFNFSSLTIGVHYTADEITRRQSNSFIKPDSEGRFSISIPTNRRITVVVESSDPTVLRATASEDGHDFYTVGERKWNIVKWIELTVVSDTPKQIDRTIELHRGAAFVLNIPSQLKSGTVSFRKSSWGRNEGTPVIWFYEGSSIHQDIVGGLEPGQWLVTYYDGNARKLKTRRVNLNVGQVQRGDK